MGVACPECKGSGKVLTAQYDRTLIGDLLNEETWEDDNTNDDHTPTDASKSTQCRVCWGRGDLG